MAKIKGSISKADFDALSDELKTLYVPDDDNYKLDDDREDVTGLKNKNKELLEKLVGFKDFEGLDAADIKAKLAKLEEAETADQVAKGKWEELEQKLKTKHAEETATFEKRIAAIVGATAQKDLQLALVAAGVKENLAEDLAISLTTKHIKHFEEGGKVGWKTLDDTETVDLAKYIPGLKESKADYFKSDLGTGSGASGSEGGGSAAQSWTRQQWDSATTKDRTAFTDAGGKITG